MCREFCEGFKSFSWKGDMEGGSPEGDPGILTEQVQATISKLFLLSNSPHTPPFLVSSEGSDQDVQHVFDMHTRIRDIALRLESEAATETNAGLMYFMVHTHHEESFRIEGDKANVLFCKERDMPCKMARIGNAVCFLKKKWLPNAVEIIESIMDYVHNRNFCNARLTGDRSEPKSMEWQVVRLANYTSSDMSAHIRRYWEKGKRQGTPYFLNDISWADREKFVFPQMQEYQQKGKIDELTFFLAFLSVSPTDFQNPVLAEMYREWAKNKDDAVSVIVETARSEGLSSLDIWQMENTIDRYVRHFDLSW